jgi:hypothetical protein
MTVDHIDPNGTDDPDNLCLACSSCNQSKFTAQQALDPNSGVTTRLFNPRIDRWIDHFEWVDGGVRITGKTEIGRATVLRLKFNQVRFIRARTNWIISGNHPPKFE